MGWFPLWSVSQTLSKRMHFYVLFLCLSSVLGFCYFLTFWQSAVSQLDSLVYFLARGYISIVLNPYTSSNDFFLSLMLYLFYKCMCFACMLPCTPCVQGLWRSEEGSGFPGSGIKDDCEWPCGRWEWNMGPLKEDQGSLSAEPSRRPLFVHLLSSISTLLVLSSTASMS